MKKVILVLVTMTFGLVVSAQLVAKVQLIEDIDGICNLEEVYLFFPMFDGQDEAVCPISDDSIVSLLNSEIQFLIDNPKHKDKGMIGLYINCTGEVVQCEMDINTKSAVLDAQIVAIFNSLGEWKSGKLNGSPVDTSRLYSFKIKKGVLTLE